MTAHCSRLVSVRNENQHAEIVNLNYTICQLASHLVGNWQLVFRSNNNTALKAFTKPAPCLPIKTFS